MINTIFFDLDGIIVDSEPIHAKAKKITLDSFGINYPSSIFDDFKGQPDDAFFKYVSRELDKQKRPFELFLNEKQNQFVGILPEMKLINGFFPFIEDVKSKGIKTVLVSSTSIYSLNLIDKVFHILHLFELIVTEEDTVNHKPHPAPYLKALQTLPTISADTIVIEDSPNGIISAKKAGCRVYALTTSFPKEKLVEADMIFDSYKELSGNIRI
jgi:beta-phosphoglucomutase